MAYRVKDFGGQVMDDAEPLELDRQLERVGRWGGRVVGLWGGGAVGRWDGGTGKRDKRHHGATPFVFL